jgi:hypothetical protein
MKLDGLLNEESKKDFDEDDLRKALYFSRNYKMTQLCLLI